MNIQFKADDKPFQNKLTNVSNNVRVRLTSWANYTARKIKIRTTPFVPLDKGTLEEGFFSHVKISTNEFGALVGYTARSKNGFDYAEIQHRRTDFRHPKRGQARYLEYGLLSSPEEIFKDAEKEIDQAMRM